MASEIMQQVQEDSRKKKQQGVLARMNSQPDQQGMGTGTRETPEPTVVEKAKEVQEEEVVAEPKIEDPRSMSTSERKLRQEQIAAEAPSHPWYRDEGNFTEKIQRGMDLDEIRGEFRGTKGEDGEMTTQKLRESAVGEDARQYAKQYSRLASENPDMSETDLQDAAIKAVRDIQSEKAAYFASKFDDVDYGEEMEDFALAQMRREQAAAAAKKKEGDQVNAAVQKAKETGPGGAGTRRQLTDAERAAKKVLEPMDVDEVLRGLGFSGETVITAEAPEDPGTAAPPTEDFRGTLAMLDEDEQAQLSKAPGGKFLKPALDSLLEGDLGGFNEAFGKIPRADGAGLPPGAFVDNDRRGVSLLNTAMGKTPQFKRQVASDLTKAIDKDNSKIYKQVSSELETVLLKKLYSEYEQLGREKPQITDAEAQKARGDAQRAAKIIMGLQVPDTNWMGDVKRLGGRTVRFTVAKNNPQYEILQGLIGDEIDSPWLGQNLSEDARKNMRENYSATETLGTLLGTTIRRGRFAVLKDAKSEGDTTPDDSPVEDIIASAAGE